MKKVNCVYPYIPNSVIETKRKMLSAIGVDSVEDIYSEIPSKLRLNRSLNLPEPYLSEYELKKHVEKIMKKNVTCKDYLNFLGGGCWQHYVPAVCDEINSRGEFLTAYSADVYADLGKYQAQFEYQSMLGELVGYDVVSSSTYDWSAAASSSLLMAVRITGRKEVLIPKTLSKDRLSHIKNFCKPAAIIKLIEYDKETGLLDIEDLRKKISDDTAAVYIENPTYLGFFETRAKEIFEIAHKYGALGVAGVDPISLGIVAAPCDYNADIVCGDLQPLGIHMNYGGGLCGFIATRDEEEYVAEIPTLLISIAPTQRSGEFGYGNCTYDRTSFVKRNEASDYTGTTSTLWAITAGVYLAIMGPQGMKEIGETIIQKSHYAIKRLSEIKGIKVPIFKSVPFKEFVVNFDSTNKKVSEINKRLLEEGIFGGKDLTQEFTEFGNSALYCITEIHSKDDIDRLANVIEEVL